MENTITPQPAKKYDKYKMSFDDCLTAYDVWNKAGMSRKPLAYDIELIGLLLDYAQGRLTGNGKLCSMISKYEIVTGARFVRSVALLLTYGASLYGTPNWYALPDGIKRYAYAAIRHHLAGLNKRDPESNYHHVKHVMANLYFLLTLTAQCKSTTT